MTERALLVALLDWVASGKKPPPSSYPRISRGELVAIDEVKFPEIPGVAFPTVVHEAYRADYGPRWPMWVTKQPPELGPPFATLVPQVDKYGNEVGGLRTVETIAPLATYAPWHVRREMAGGNGELTDFFGTFIPLAKTEEEREASGDSRPSIAGRWSSKEAYLSHVTAATRELMQSRTLLEEDVPRVMQRAEATWDYIMTQ